MVKSTGSNTTVNDADVVRIVSALDEIAEQIEDLQLEKKQVLKDAAALGLNKKTLGKVMARKRETREVVVLADRDLRDYEMALGLSVLM